MRINGAEQARVTGLLRTLEMTEREDGLSTLEMQLDNVASDGGVGVGVGSSVSPPPHGENLRLNFGADGILKQWTKVTY